MEIKELAEHCKRQLDRLPKTSKEYEEHLLTLAIIKTNRKYFKELDKKGKIIDLMAEYIATLDIEEDICANIENDNCDKMALGECEECIKQYFAELVEKE